MDDLFTIYLPFPPDLVQYGPVQYTLVKVECSGIAYKFPCTYYPITSSPTLLLKWLLGVKFMGGLVEQTMNLSEGHKDDEDYQRTLVRKEGRRGGEVGGALDMELVEQALSNEGLWIEGQTFFCFSVS